MQLTVLFIGVLQITEIAGPFWSQVDVEDDRELATAVSEIEVLRRSPATKSSELEAVAARWLSGFSEPARRGVLRFHLANAYAQNGMQERDALLRHAQAALLELVDPARRAALHTFAGDATRLGLGGPPDAASRTGAAEWYLKGLHEIEQLKIPAEIPPDELMSFFHTGDEERDRRLAAEQKARFLEREHIRMMHVHSTVLRGQLVSLYKPHPDERAVLQRLCDQYLNDPAACVWLMQQIPESPDVALIEGSAEAQSRFWWILFANLAVFLAVVLIAFCRRRLRQRRAARGTDTT